MSIEPLDPRNRPLTGHPPLAATPEGLTALRGLTDLTLRALQEGRRRRGGPIGEGGPESTADLVRSDTPFLLPDEGVGARRALRTLVSAVAAGAADPADPMCAAHLHTAPLAVAVAADLAASVLNPSMDSWDQAPAASELERLVTEAVADLSYPGNTAADAVVTTGATESNLVALLLAREIRGPEIRAVCSAEAHHSVHKAAWTLGLAPPVHVPTGAGGRMEPTALAEVLAAVPGPHLVVATAGTTDRGAIDPIAGIAEVARPHGAHLHVDAAYGGGLLLGDRRGQLAGIESADTIALDMHKFGWQPLAAGLLALRDRRLLAPLSTQADYLNADDDVSEGFPDLLGRSIRTSRRPDALKMAVTFQALGRSGLAAMVDACCGAATDVADMIDRRPDLRLLDRPEISTVLFRPSVADTVAPGEGDELVSRTRRALLVEGTAVIGRATVDGQVWLKLTLLNPETSRAHLRRVLDLVADTAHSLLDPSAPLPVARTA